MSTTTFTPARAARFPAPDLARGFMLILIALANVPWWTSKVAAQAENLNDVDKFWLLLRTGFIDQRALPLFACLFGFGLATMAARRTSELPTDGDKRLTKAAQTPARKLLRRRGWWMLLFGLVHGLLFPGDIIGVYAVAAIVLAGLIAHRYTKTMIALAVLFFLIVIAEGTDDSGGESLSAHGTGLMEAMGQLGLPLPMTNLFAWSMMVGFGAFSALVVPAMVAGVLLARTTIISDPARHRRLLTWVAIGGLTLGFLGALPFGLHVANYATGTRDSLLYTLNMAAAPLTAVGWLALFALLAIPMAKTESSKVNVFTAVGQRSMTAYIGQSIVYFTLFSILAATGLKDSVGPALTVPIALATWALIAVVCVMLARAGKRGPFEVLLRRAVAWGEKKPAATLEPTPARAMADADAHVERDPAK